MLREAIEAHGAILGPEGIDQLKNLASHLAQADELFPVEQPVQAGNYSIESLIATGGSADVYRAVEPPPLSRTVAIKILRRGLLSPQALERFRFERDSVKGLDHPHIAPVLDAGDTHEGLPFIVMPFIEGDHVTKYAEKENL